MQLCWLLAGGCEERVRSIHQVGVPIVLVDRTVEIGDSKLDSVVESNFESAYRLTSYLLQQGASIDWSCKWIVKR